MKREIHKFFDKIWPSAFIFEKCLQSEDCQVICEMHTIQHISTYIIINSHHGFNFLNL